MPDNKGWTYHATMGSQLYDNVTKQQIRARISLNNEETAQGQAQILARREFGKEFVLPEEKKINYTGHHKETNTYVRELWGKRSNQEDSVVADTIPGFEQLTDVNREAALKDMVESLQTTIQKRNDGKSQKDISGAALSAAVICGNQVCTANVGDSNVFVAIMSPKEPFVTVRRLTQELHSVGAAKESARIKAAGHNVSYFPGDVPRLDGKLALSRSMGDEHSEYKGFHDPDIYIDTIDIPPGGKAFVINACDGLTEAISKRVGEEEEKRASEAWLQEEISKIVLKDGVPNRSLLQADIASQLSLRLAAAAIHAGSKDNVSLAVTRIEPTNPNAKYTGVFDGHGGDMVSRKLEENFHQALDKAVQNRLQMQVQAQAQQAQKAAPIQQQQVNQHLSSSAQLNNALMQSARLPEKNPPAPPRRPPPLKAQGNDSPPPLSPRRAVGENLDPPDPADHLAFAEPKQLNVYLESDQPPPLPASERPPLLKAEEGGRFAAIQKFFKTGFLEEIKQGRYNAAKYAIYGGHKIESAIFRDKEGTAKLRVTFDPKDPQMSTEKTTLTFSQDKVVCNKMNDVAIQAIFDSAVAAGVSSLNISKLPDHVQGQFQDMREFYPHMKLKSAIQPPDLDEGAEEEHQLGRGQGSSRRKI